MWWVFPLHFLDVVPLFKKAFTFSVETKLCPFQGKDTGLFRKAIEKISTEYRLQFAWPQSHISRRDATDSAPKKSQSMGALKANANAAMVHKKRMDLENKDGKTV